MNSNLSYKKFPLKINLTIWYMLILLIVLLFFSAVIYFNLKTQLETEARNILQLEVNNLKNELANLTQAEFNTYSNQADRYYNDPDIEVFFYNQAGKLESDLEINPFIPERINGKPRYNIIEYQGQKWSFMIDSYQLKGNNIQPKAGYLMVIYSLKKEQLMLKKLLLTMLIIIPLTLLLASGGGYFLSNRALTAIDIISATAEKISQSNLSKRIEIAHHREDEIGRLVKTLNNLLARLENSFYRQKQFNADVSHELRTPISVIKAHVDDALELDQHLTTEQKNIFLTIKNQVDQMNSMISQMLILARADDNNVKLDKEKFDLIIVIAAVIEEMNLQAAEKDIKIESNFKQQSEFLVKADLSLITQLLLNLVDNAIKYTRSGGKIKISLTDLNNYYKISVIDNGIGIKDTDLNNIFKRFYRVDKSRSRQYGGTGLGLSICKWIVDMHGGEITVKSNWGSGTEFSVFLLKEKSSSDFN